MHETQQEQAQSTHQPNHEQEQAPPVYTTTQEEEELNVFDILEEDVSDIGEDDPIEEEQIEDLTGEDDLEWKGFDSARHSTTGMPCVSRSTKLSRKVKVGSESNEC